MTARCVHVQLTLKRARSSSTDRSAPAHEACNVELTTGGGASATATAKRLEATPSMETLEGDFDLAHLRAVVSAQAGSFRICATEIALGEATRKRLATFVERFDAELASQTQEDTSEGQKLEL